jgi:hypothetical protein
LRRAALAIGAQALVSADQAFAVVPGLAHIDPGTRELEALLRS